MIRTKAFKDLEKYFIKNKNISQYDFLPSLICTENNPQAQLAGLNCLQAYTNYTKMKTPIIQNIYDSVFNNGKEPSLIKSYEMLLQLYNSNGLLKLRW